MRRINNLGKPRSNDPPDIRAWITESLRQIEAASRVTDTMSDISKEDAEAIRRALGLSFAGALVKKSVDQTAADYTTATAVTWNVEPYDEGGWHDNATNPSRLTVPAGVTRAQAYGTVSLTNVATTDSLIWQLRKNGTPDFVGFCGFSGIVGIGTPVLSFESAPLVVVPGDYFEAFLKTSADTSITVVAASSTFGIKSLHP